MDHVFAQLDHHKAHTSNLVTKLESTFSTANDALIDAHHTTASQMDSLVTASAALEPRLELIDRLRDVPLTEDVTTLHDLLANQLHQGQTHEWAKYDVSSLSPTEHLPALLTGLGSGPGPQGGRARRGRRPARERHRAAESDQAGSRPGRLIHYSRKHKKNRQADRLDWCRLGTPRLLWPGWSAARSPTPPPSPSCAPKQTRASRVRPPN